MKELETEQVTECPCCKGDMFEQLDSYYVGDDEYEVRWTCSDCGAIWLEEYRLSGVVLIKEGEVDDQS